MDTRIRIPACEHVSMFTRRIEPAAMPTLLVPARPNNMAARVTVKVDPLGTHDQFHQLMLVLQDTPDLLDRVAAGQGTFMWYSKSGYTLSSNLLNAANPTGFAAPNKRTFTTCSPIWGYVPLGQSTQAGRALVVSVIIESYRL